MLCRRALPVVAVALLSCTRAGQESKQAQAPAAGAPVENEAQARAELHREGDLPRWDGLGLPLSGDIQYSVALESPGPDLSRASGKILFECDECRLGTGKERVYRHRAGGAKRPRAPFGSSNLTLPQIPLGTVEATIRFRDGEGELEATADAGGLYQIEVTGTVKLAPEVEASRVEARCDVEPGPELERAEDPLLRAAPLLLGEGLLIRGRLGALEVLTEPSGHRLSRSPPPALDRDAGPVSLPRPDASAEQPSRATPPWLAALAKEVKPGRFVVKRAVLSRLAKESHVWLRSCRIVPSISNGEPSGFKLYAIREDSAPDLLGFENGDELTRVGDVEVVDFDKALEAWEQVREASSVKVHLRRAGKERIHHYRIE